jgi:hypothetical protein
MNTLLEWVIIAALAICAIVLILATAVIVTDFTLYEDGSFSGSLPFTQAWRD